MRLLVLGGTRFLGRHVVEEVTGATYGPLKALCEQEAHAAFPGRAAAVRAGLIVGPHDPTDRFTYWPVRFARGGEVVCPPHADQPVQFVDARDLAAWMLDLGERGIDGTFNATGPAARLTFGEFLDACRTTSGSDASCTRPDAGLLEAQGVEMWTDLPLAVAPENSGFMEVDTAAARSAGLTFRPLEETLRDTLDWARSRGSESLRAGLSVDRENEILAAWRNRGGRE